MVRRLHQENLIWIETSDKIWSRFDADELNRQLRTWQISRWEPKCALCGLTPEGGAKWVAAFMPDWERFYSSLGEVGPMAEDPGVYATVHEAGSVSLMNSVLS